MTRRQALTLGLLGALIAGLSAVALIVGFGGGGDSVLVAGTEAPGTTAAATEPTAAEPTVTEPTSPTATVSTSTTTTTEAPPVTAPAPIYAVEGLVRGPNQITHTDPGDPDCAGLTFEYSAVAPREMRLPGEPIGRVRTVVIVDMWSEPADMEEAEYSLELAGEHLYGLTGFGFEMTEYVLAYPPDGDFIKAAIPHCYLQTIADLPDHVILYTYGLNDNARSYGGYADYLDARSPFSVWAPDGWSNRFTNETLGGVQMYVSVIHWNHRYSRCGYEDYSGETPVSEVAIGGECRGQDGTMCVAGPEYQICPDELSNPYAYRANYRATTIVHELMHPFGRYGNGDHTGAPQCNAEMGLPEGSFDDAIADQYFSMCEYVWDLFVAGYTG